MNPDPAHLFKIGDTVTADTPDGPVTGTVHSYASPGYTYYPDPLSLTPHPGPFCWVYVPDPGGGLPTGLIVAEASLRPAGDRDAHLTPCEVDQLAAMGLIEIVEPRADGSYPDNMPIWLTERGADVFYPLVDHSRDLDRLLAREHT